MFNLIYYSLKYCKTHIFQDFTIHLTILTFLDIRFGFSFSDLILHPVWEKNMLKNSIEVFIIHNTKNMRFYATIKVKKKAFKNVQQCINTWSKLTVQILFRDCILPVVKLQSLNHAETIFAQKQGLLYIFIKEVSTTEITTHLNKKQYQNVYSERTIFAFF